MVNRAKRPDRRHLLAAVRHPARRDGVIALVLFVLPWVALARPGEQVVVTCRTEQYQTMVSPQDGQGATLRAAAV